MSSCKKGATRLFYFLEEKKGLHFKAACRLVSQLRDERTAGKTHKKL